jgi:hypothetical protein
VDGEAAGDGAVEALGLAAGEAEAPGLAEGDADARGLAERAADGEPEADGEAAGEAAGGAVEVTPVVVPIDIVPIESEDVVAASGNCDVSMRRSARRIVSSSVSLIVLQRPFSQNCRVGLSPAVWADAGAEPSERLTTIATLKARMPTPRPSSPLPIHP